MASVAANSSTGRRCRASGWGAAALKRVVDTFFSGSLGEAVASHLSDPNGDLSDEDLDELMALVERKRGKNRKNTNAELKQS